MAIEATQTYLDRNVLGAPLPLVRRTPRELACIAIGVWIVASELSEARHAMFYVNLALGVGGTLIFLSRFFLARIAGTAAGFAAGTQWWIGREEALSQPLEMGWRAYACLAVIVVLASPDLVRRFDRHRSFRWWPNPWAHLGRFDYAALRFSLYLLFMLSALILKGYSDHLGLGLQSRVGWVNTHTTGLVVTCLVLAFGRRFGLLLLPIMHLWTLFLVLPQRVPPGQTLMAPPQIFIRMAHVAQPALLLATVGTLLSTILAVRYLRRQLSFDP